MLDACEIGRIIATWSKLNKREFSFRQADDPFWLLVSEMLLRKTTARQVDRVYPTLVDRYPNPEALAAADEAELANVLRPLGIASRARQLIMMANAIIGEHEGKIPADYSSLTALAGVGPYAASVVMSISFGESRPMIDANVVRVIGRVAGVPQSNCVKDIKRISLLYDRMMPKGGLQDFHYGVIDISAMYCRPLNPKCTECPLEGHCASHRTVV